MKDNSTLRIDIVGGEVQPRCQPDDQEDGGEADGVGAALDRILEWDGDAEEIEFVDEDRWSELLEEMRGPTYTQGDVFSRTLAWVEDQFEHFKRVGTFRR